MRKCSLTTTCLLFLLMLPHIVSCQFFGVKSMSLGESIIGADPCWSGARNPSYIYSRKDKWGAAISNEYGVKELNSFSISFIKKKNRFCYNAMLLHAGIKDFNNKGAWFGVAMEGAASTIGASVGLIRNYTIGRAASKELFVALGVNKEFSSLVELAFSLSNISSSKILNDFRETGEEKVAFGLKLRLDKGLILYPEFEYGLLGPSATGRIGLKYEIPESLEFTIGFTSKGSKFSSGVIIHRTNILWGICLSYHPFLGASSAADVTF